MLQFERNRPVDFRVLRHMRLVSYNAQPAPPMPTLPAGSAAPPPLTRSDVNGLQMRVGLLKGQLDAANSRRDRLASQLRRADGGADRTGLEERLGQLDKRILQIETDIATVGDALATAPTGSLSGSVDPGRTFQGPTPGQMTAISIVGTLFVLFPLSLAFTRLLWRRAMLAPRAQALVPELANRLDRIEQGIDVVALEVERISEGQRFVSQLMSGSATEEKIGVGRLPGPPTGRA